MKLESRNEKNNPVKTGKLFGSLGCDMVTD